MGSESPKPGLRTYKDLFKSCAVAKRYEMSADDSLLVTFYSLAPNQTYLAELINDDDLKGDIDRRLDRKGKSRRHT